MQSVSIVNLASLPAVPPKLVQPYGTLYDQTPTYKFKRVGGATKYQYRVYTSTGTLKFTRTVYDSSCGTTYCVKVPAVTLPYTKYKWQARAYVGGTYSAWSSFKNFTIAKPPSGFSSSFNGSMTGWKKKAGGAFKVNYTEMYSFGNDYWNSVYRSTAKYANFTYSAVVKRTGGEGAGTIPASYLTVRMGTSVDATDHEWYPGLYFGYTNGGCSGPCYGIYRTKTDGSFLWVQSWTASSAIKAYDWNTLKVVVNGPLYKFYINGTLVKKFSNTSRSIGYVGMQFYKVPGGGSTRFSADSAKLSTILKTDLLDDEVSAEQEALNQAAMLQPAEQVEFITAP
jgi:hypothetical protein